MKLHGIGVTRGIAIGRVFRLDRPRTGGALASGGKIVPAEELAKLAAALEKSREQIRKLLSRETGERAEIIATQLDYFDDPSFAGDAEALINKGMSAAEALRRVTDDLVETFNSFDDDPYMQGRSADIADAGRRVLDNLEGRGDAPPPELPENAVLVAEDLAPSQTIALDLSRLRGFVTQGGSKTSHTAILAGSMGIAAVVGCASVLEEARDGEDIIVDARTGEVILRPEAEEIGRYRGLFSALEGQRALEKQAEGLRIVRRDGGKCLVAANVGSPEEARIAKKRGADAIGLFRTEFLYMGRPEMPGEEEQYRAYREAAEIFGGAPVTIRTLDIGGDKKLPYITMPPEENPAMGLRAIRFCLKNRSLFETQLRAILRASAYGNLRVMFPMIQSPAEFHAARDILKHCAASLEKEGIPCKPRIPAGMMVEIPAAAVMAETFALEADFFSIGTNDLTQYTLAVDRGNPAVGPLYDGLHPAVLSLIKQTIAAARRQAKPCCVCGELAGDPRALPILAEYGLEEFSVALDSIGRTKSALVKLDGFSSMRI
jgi:phosphotransferase system enzyme I (PtsI)